MNQKQKNNLQKLLNRVVAYKPESARKKPNKQPNKAELEKVFSLQKGKYSPICLPSSVIGLKRPTPRHVIVFCSCCVWRLFCQIGLDSDCCRAQVKTPSVSVRS